MKKFLKISGIAVAVLLAILIIVPMTLTSKVGAIVKTEAGKMLTAKLDFADLDISLLRHFPHASIDLEGLTIIGADVFEQDTLLSARRISVVVNVMSLFADDGFEVTKLILNSPSVNARKLADGRVNWDIMKPTAEEPSAEEESSEPSSFRLQMRDVRIEGAQIRYGDDSLRMYFSTAPLSLRLRGDMSAQHTAIDMTLVASAMNLRMGNVTMLRDVEAELNAVIDADLENKRFIFENNTMRLNAIKLGVNGWAQLLADNGMAVDITADSSKVQFRDVLSLVPALYTRDFKDLTASGELSFGAWVKGEYKDNCLPAFAVKLGVKDGSVKYAALPKSVSGINIDASVSNNGGVIDNTVVEVPRFTMTMAGNSLAASLTARTPISDLDFKAAADGKIDLGAIREVYPLSDSVKLGGIITMNVRAAGKMSDIEHQRYESIAASGTVAVEQITAAVGTLPQVQIHRAAASITPRVMTLSELSMTVGRSDIAARGSLSNYIGYFLRNTTLGGRLTVTSTLLDLNEFISSQSTDTVDTSAEGAADGAATATAPEVPKNLDLTMTATVGKILLQKMIITDFVGGISVKDGTVQLDKLNMKAFDGTLTTSGSYSTSGGAASPALALNLRLASASFEQTFRQLDVVQKIVPLFAKTGGDYSMSMNMTTRMTSDLGVDYPTLNAKGSIASANIKVQNIEAFEKMAQALKNDKLKNIEAKDVKIDFTIENGRIRTAPFDIKMGNISMNMSGTTGLDQTIDYTAKVSLPQGASSLLSTVNVGIGGTFSSPKISVDVKDAAKQAVGSAINQQVERLTGSKSLNEEAQKQIAKLRSEAKTAGDKLVAAAERERDSLVAKANGKIAKFAAQKAGDALVKKAEENSAKLQSEADRKATELETKMQK